ncbi:MAG: RNA polymerase sigma factor [Gemmatimonadales bacterium]|nr:RNA polymerase sigma factor [Gemmatimonadales bacterium]
MSDSAEELRLFRQGLVEGDDEAWRTLYRRHTPGLLRLAELLADRPDDADDLVHDTWLRAARGAARFAERSLVRTWLTGILLNCIREWRRASVRAGLVELPDDLPGPDPEPPHGVDRLDLERVVAGLPPGYREVLLLHDVEGYTHVEIADLLGIEAGTSKSQLSRARRAVVRALGPEEGGKDA